MEQVKTDEAVVGTAPLAERIRTGLRGVVQPFIDVIHAPRALWGINLSFFLEGFVYWGILVYVTMYFTQYVFASSAHPDIPSHYMYGVLTGGITFAMFFLGPVADRLGPRKATLVGLLFMLIGRSVLAAAPGTSLPGGSYLSPLNLMAGAGLLIIVAGYGLYQPAAYLGVRKFTSARTAPMGYAMLYALMNLGGWFPSFMSPVRDRYGIAGAIWFYAGVNALTLVLTAIVLTRRVERAAVEDAAAGRDELPDPSVEAQPRKSIDQPSRPPSAHRGFREAVKNHPLANPRFSFFIFSLIPVQTLFVYANILMPHYVTRAYRGSIIADRFEFATNLNALLIFILVPIVTALTSHKRIYSMMIWGTLVMALPTFLLVIGPHWWTLVPYLVIMSVGEAMWQPRFLQYAAEIAPEGRTGAYMGVAQLPWFLTKVLVPLYSGWMMDRFCPEEGELRTERMWLIFACVAMMSTVLLVLAKNWVGRGFKERAA